MILDSDKSLYAAETAAPANGIPASNFSFGQVIGGLWNSVILPGAQVYGQIEVAKANAAAQAKLDALKNKNATLGPNDPKAAQEEANKTLMQKWLPSSMAGTNSNGILPWVILGTVLLVGLLVLRKLLK